MLTPGSVTSTESDSYEKAKVEGDAELRNLYRIQLRMAGYTVVAVGDARPGARFRPTQRMRYELSLRRGTDLSSWASDLFSEERRRRRSGFTPVRCAAVLRVAPSSSRSSSSGIV
jgi:hypothetical protein